MLSSTLHEGLGIHVGTEVHVLQSNDSMYFDSSVPHGYARRGRRACRAIVVTTGYLPQLTRLIYA